MPIPFFSISLTATGADITAGIASGNVSLEIVESEGEEGHTANIVVDDKDGCFAEPEPGTKIGIVAGYVGNARDFGVFTIESVTDEGWPQKITISAQSIDVTSTAKQQMTQGFPNKDYPTYGDVFAKLAADAGMALSIAGEIASKANEYVGQAAEDPLSFATRIAEKINGAVSYPSGRMVVTAKGSGNSVSGTALTSIDIRRPGNVVSYSRTRNGKAEYSSVKSTWMDRNAAELKEQTASTGLRGPEYLVRASKQNEQDAQDEADSKAKDLAAAAETASFTINGEPSATAGAVATVSGIKSTIDGAWIAKQVSHSWTGDGPYTTAVECEKKV